MPLVQPDFSIVFHEGDQYILIVNLDYVAIDYAILVCIGTLNRESEPDNQCLILGMSKTLLEPR